MDIRDDHVAQSISSLEYIYQSLTYPHQNERPYHQLSHPQP
jgi:hypothetical protein